MKLHPWIVRSLAFAGLLLAAAPSALAQETTSFEVTGRYTAQRKPRVAVLEFEDTNSEAKSQRYGSSVQAMLVTYLKRKSQIVVVERQKLGDVLAEWQRNQKGLTNLQPEDPTARELLERIDAIILGSVTLLDDVVEQRGQGEGGPGAAGEKVHRGPRIEIDAKLLSRSDGRIIAAAQRNGTVSCLRGIVERLGVALEQEYLRPYYGQLKFELDDPEHVTVFLTPILLDTALDEEKPPVERRATVKMGSRHDIVESWTTDPTTYTIENLLSGWYSMRLERPGYEGLGTENFKWEARDDYGRVQVYERDTGMPLPRGLIEQQKRFIVHVDPLGRAVIKGNDLGLEFRKKGGSLSPRVKRQYVDKDFTHSPQRVVLVSKRMDINELEGAGEYADDKECDQFKEPPPNITDYGLTVVTSGQPFDFEGFKGGAIYFEDYKGETLPVGEYSMTLWEPHYLIGESDVLVRHQDKDKLVRSTLQRETGALVLGTTGLRPPHKVTVRGEATGHQVVLPLDFDNGKLQPSLPVDRYVAATDVPGLTGWRRAVELPSKNVTAPFFDIKEETAPVLKFSPDGEDGEKKDGPEEPPPGLRVKTRMVVGGRLSALTSSPDVNSPDLHVDRELTVILDLLLYGAQKDEEEGTNVWRTLLVGMGKQLLYQTALGLAQQSPDSSEGRLAALAALASAERQPAPSPAGSAAAGTESPAGETGTAPGPGQEPPAPPAPQPISIDPEALRELFAEHLEDLDLLILDDEDLARLREMPELTPLLVRYVESGGALFAFASESGDYGRVIGSPLVLKTGGKPTERFELTPGEISGLSLRVEDKKVQVKSKRILPELERLDSGGTWRVVAFGKGRKDVRIVERGYRDQGGYIAVWLDDPGSFRGRWGGAVDQVESVRAKVEKYVLEWARFLMNRRYGKATEEPRRAG